MNLRLPILAALLLCAGIAQASTNAVLKGFNIGGGFVLRVQPPAAPATNSGASGGTTSLAYHLATNLVAHTVGFTNPLAAMAYLQVTNDYPNGFYQYATSYGPAWSTNCWLAGVQGLSATGLGFAVTNQQTDDGEYMITMVSPRHYLCASHVTWANFFLGLDAVVFLDTNGVTYYRKSLQLTNLPNSDTTVGLLDADLPASVGFLPLLPGNYTNWLAPGAAVEGVGVNQDYLVSAVAVTFNGGWVVDRGDTVVTNGLGRNWTSCADPIANCYGRAGDSSSPIRLLIGNQLVLVSAMTTGVSGDNYASEGAAINAAMHWLSTNNAVGTDYQLSTIDLTGWPTL